MSQLLRRAWLSFDRVMLPSLPAARLGAFRVLVCLVALYDVMLYSSMVFADGLVELSETVTAINQGDLVDYLPFSEVGL